MTQSTHGRPVQTPIDTAELERLDRILRDPLSGLTWDNRIMAADAIREVLAHRKAEAWQPIETAPHETLVVVGWYVGDVWKQEIALASAVIRYSNGYSDRWQHGRATHWRPLPAPPTTPTTEVSHDE